MIGDRPGRRAGEVPAVVFVDVYGWSAFFQLAASLRREGFRVLRVTLRPPSRVASALCWDRTVTMTSPTELSGVFEILADEDIVDVHVVEPLIRYMPPPSVGGPGERARQWQERFRLADKLTMARELDRIGIPVPDARPLTEMTPDDAVAFLGLPLVIKPMIGSGGEDVSIVRSEEELEQTVAGLAAPEGFFYEQFVAGRVLQVGAVASEQGVELSTTYASAELPGDLGPSSRIELIDDFALTSLAEQVAKGLGLQGMFNLGIIRDNRGRDLVHDVNLRAWGSFGALQANGADLAGTYTAWLTGRAPARTDLEPACQGEIAVFPRAWDEIVAEGPRLAAPVRLLRWMWPYLLAFGPRYLAYELSVRTRIRLQRMAAARMARGAATAADRPPGRGQITSAKPRSIRSKMKVPARNTSTGTAKDATT